ncbi:hypothetical protein, partial [Pedobacter psychrotolerans]|uniref:hypothetical protein n=1 Tax=Pedobacter psychrotolerans TaxID=1843235 RepID=UPI001E38D747
KPRRRLTRTLAVTTAGVSSFKERPKTKAERLKWPAWRRIFYGVIPFLSTGEVAAGRGGY